MEGENGGIESLVEIRPNRKLKIRTYQSIQLQGNSELTIFFYHGSMASLIQFEQLYAIFHGRCNIVAYDALGCGSSEKPVDNWFGESVYNTNNLLKDGIEVFKNYATKQNVLLGHSFGTTIVARIYNHFQTSDAAVAATICGVVLLGTADKMLETANPIFYLPVWALELLHPILSSGFADRAFSPSVDPEIKKRALEFSGKNVMHVVRSFYLNNQWASDDIWRCVSPVPVLICQGIDDRITPLEKAQHLYDKFLKHNPKSKIETIDNCGHQVMQEKPAIVGGLIESFIRTSLELSLP